MSNITETVISLSVDSDNPEAGYQSFLHNLVSNIAAKANASYTEKTAEEITNQFTIFSVFNHNNIIPLNANPLRAWALVYKENSTWATAFSIWGSYLCIHIVPCPTWKSALESKYSDWGVHSDLTNADFDIYLTLPFWNSGTISDLFKKLCYCYNLSDVTQIILRNYIAKNHSCFGFNVGSVVETNFILALGNSNLYSKCSYGNYCVYPNQETYTADCVTFRDDEYFLKTSNVGLSNGVFECDHFFNVKSLITKSYYSSQFPFSGTLAPSFLHTISAVCLSTSYYRPMYTFDKNIIINGGCSTEMATFGIPPYMFFGMFPRINQGQIITYPCYTFGSTSPTDVYKGINNGPTLSPGSIIKVNDKNFFVLDSENSISYLVEA